MRKLTLCLLFAVLLSGCGDPHSGGNLPQATSPERTSPKTVGEYQVVDEWDLAWQGPGIWFSMSSAVDHSTWYSTAEVITVKGDPIRIIAKDEYYGDCVRFEHSTGQPKAIRMFRASDKRYFWVLRGPLDGSIPQSGAK